MKSVDLRLSISLAQAGVEGKGEGGRGKRSRDRDTNQFLERLQLPVCFDQQLLLIFPSPQGQQRARAVALLHHFLGDLVFAVEHGLDLLLVLPELVALDFHVQDGPEEPSVSRGGGEREGKGRKERGEGGVREVPVLGRDSVAVCVPHGVQSSWRSRSGGGDEMGWRIDLGERNEPRLSRTHRVTLSSSGWDERSAEYVCSPLSSSRIHYAYSPLSSIYIKPYLFFLCTRTWLVSTQ